MSSLRDIYRYINPGTAGSLGDHGVGGDNPFALVNNSDMSDEDFRRAMTVGAKPSSFQHEREWTGQDFRDKWSVRPDSFLGSLGQRFGNVNFDNVQNENGTRGSLNVDTARMPKTPFGDVRNTAAVDDQTDLINPRAVVNDSSYGRITPLQNIKGNPELEMAVQAMIALGGGAIGGMAGMASRLGVGAVNAARAMGSGNWQGALGGALNFIPGMQPWLAGALRMGLGQLNQPRRSSQPDLAAEMRRRYGGGP